jgi:hypothetical protein
MLVRWLTGAKKNRPLLQDLELKLTGHPLDLFRWRSEDVRFSPSGQRLAVITSQAKLLLFAIDANARPVTAQLLTTMASADLRAAHGVDWIDEDTLVVANRAAGLAFFKIPRSNQWAAESKIAAVSIVQSSWFGAPDEKRQLNAMRKVATGPGSARIHDGYVYAGCNMSNTVTRHRILAGPTCDDGELVAQEGINIPDSAIVSPDGVWLAVADHYNHRVLIFRLGEKSPCGALTDPRLKHPHGIAINPSGTVIVAADAGGRGIFAFHARDGLWNVHQTEAFMIDGVTEAVYARVQSEVAEQARDVEGGAKGIDISKDGRVVVSTCRGQTLRFFELHAG